MTWSSSSPAVPVRRGHAEPEDRALALLRPARLPAGPGRPEEQHQHARDLRAGGPGLKDKEHVKNLRHDRRRSDARVPDGHPRPAERPRRDPLRHHQGRRAPPRDHDPRHQRLARAADAAGRGRRQPRGSGLERDVPDRRGGVPEGLVRRLRGRVAPPGNGTAEEKPNVLQVAGGDSFGGATPPISNFFEDKPTPPIMNMMGIDADTLGNHSFDRGEAFLRNAADPARGLPDAEREHRLSGREVPEGMDGLDLLPLPGGIKLGIIGFTTESTPMSRSRATSGRSWSGRSCRRSTPRRRSSPTRPRRDRRARPRRRVGRDDHRPERTADRHRRQRPRASTS